MTKAIALDLHSLDHIRDARKVLMSDVTVAIETNFWSVTAS